MKKVLLYSGGLDSFLIDFLWKPDIKLYIDLKTDYSLFEKQSLSNDVIIKELPLLKEFEKENNIIPLRNLYFILLATNYGEEICLGATYGDRVLDKSNIFAKKSTNLLNYLYKKQWWTDKKTFKVVLPFKRYTKIDLLGKYLKKGGDIARAWHLSKSCYHPINNEKECWNCKPCIRKWLTFAYYDFRIVPKPNNIEQFLKDNRGRETKQYKEIKL